LALADDLVHRALPSRLRYFAATIAGGIGCARDSEPAATEWPHAKSQGQRIEFEDVAPNELRVGNADPFYSLSANFRGYRIGSILLTL